MLASPDQLADRPHLELPDLGRIEHVQKRLEPQIVRPEVSIAEAVDERNAGSQDREVDRRAGDAGDEGVVCTSDGREREEGAAILAVEPGHDLFTREAHGDVVPDGQRESHERGPPAEPIGGTGVAPEPGRQVLPFGGGEGQLVLRHLDQLVAGSQVGEGDRRRLTARQEEVSVGWQPPHEVAEETCRGRINRDLVNVVDDQADVER